MEKERRAKAIEDAKNEAKKTSPPSGKGGKTKKPSSKAEQEQLLMAEMTLGQDALQKGTFTMIIASLL
jgi:hypothetical protein